MAIATSPKQYPLISSATLALTVLQLISVPLNLQLPSINLLLSPIKPLPYNITAGNPNLDGDGISAFTINNNGQIAMADCDDKAVVISLP